MRLKFNMRNMTFCFAAVFIVACWGYQSSAQFGSTQTGGGFGIGNNGNPPEPPEPKKLDATAAKNAPPVARLDFKSAAHVKIEKALQSKTECEFVDCPLGDVIEFFQDAHKITITIDKKAIDEGDIDVDEPIDFVTDNMSLKSTLVHILKPLNLYFHIENESLVIATGLEEVDNLVIVVYDVRKLLAAGFEHTGLRAAIAMTASYPSADIDMGEGEAIPLRGCFVVKQTYHGHKEIFDMLQQLERVVDRKITKTISN